jgi:hypothetical protein
MARHPYETLPEYTRWSRAVARPAFGDVDPVVDFPFHILPEHRVATAGSCFAQHIARHLHGSGFCYFVTEDGHPLGSEEDRAAYNYGTFSARYGNVYTCRQLLQLFRRAYGEFVPLEDCWTLPGGVHLDPLRPNIQPNGFASVEELRADRTQHLAAVRRMFEELDVFVFTLGLTESWFSRDDGTVYPVCPGVAGGVFDDTRYGFVNFNVEQCLSDMRLFIARLRAVNPKSKIVLTVSPVPLVATAENRHVLVSTTYSKSALRVVCEELIKSERDVAYFPSYEIIVGGYNRGQYFAEDLRSVTEAGVEHVMRLFLKHAAHVEAAAAAPAPARKEPDAFIARMTKVVQSICEEELIERSFKDG